MQPKVTAGGVGIWAEMQPKLNEFSIPCCGDGGVVGVGVWAPGPGARRKGWAETENGATPHSRTSMGKLDHHVFCISGKFPLTRASLKGILVGEGATVASTVTKAVRVWAGGRNFSEGASWSFSWR